MVLVSLRTSQTSTGPPATRSPGMSVPTQRKLSACLNRHCLSVPESSEPHRCGSMAAAPSPATPGSVALAGEVAARWHPVQLGTRPWQQHAAIGLHWLAAVSPVAVGPVCQAGRPDHSSERLAHLVHHRAHRGLQPGAGPCQAQPACSALQAGDAGGHAAPHETCLSRSPIQMSLWRPREPRCGVHRCCATSLAAQEAARSPPGQTVQPVVLLLSLSCELQSALQLTRPAVIPARLHCCATRTKARPAGHGRCFSQSGPQVSGAFLDLRGTGV